MKPHRSMHHPGDGRGPRTVYLDGVEVEDVISADEANGWVKVPLKDDAGNDLGADENMDELYQIMLGKVTVEF